MSFEGILKFFENSPTKLDFVQGPWGGLRGIFSTLKAKNIPTGAGSRLKNGTTGGGESPSGGPAKKGIFQEKSTKSYT